MKTKWICLWALPHYNVLSLQKETSFCYVTTQMRATELYKLYTTLWCCLFYLFFSKKNNNNKNKWSYDHFNESCLAILVDLVILWLMLVQIMPWALVLTYSWRKFWVWNWNNNSLNRRTAAWEDDLTKIATMDVQRKLTCYSLYLQVLTSRICLCLACCRKHKLME